MLIKHLSLHNFRNFTQLELDLGPGLNLFIGDNAQGKTNLLEACHLLATARSHRTHRDSEMIEWERQGYHIGAELKTKRGTEHLDLRYDSQLGKRAQINGASASRLSDLIGQLKVVLFAPEHLSLVKGEPGLRRRFLDILLSQLYHKYLYELSQYQQILRQKATLLKSSAHDAQLLQVYNAQLASLAASLTLRRAETIQQLAMLSAEYHRRLHPEEKLVLTYESQIDPQPPFTLAHLRRDYEQLLQHKQAEELRRRICLVGIQRDDLGFKLNGENARSFSSQGQQRSIVLTLKIAEAHFMDRISEERPVLILDDLFSELDSTRQHNLLESLHSFGQTLISSVQLPPLLHSHQKDVYRVAKGQVQRF